MFVYDSDDIFPERKKKMDTNGRAICTVGDNFVQWKLILYN